MNDAFGDRQKLRMDGRKDSGELGVVVVGLMLTYQQCDCETTQCMSFLLVEVAGEL